MAFLELVGLTKTFGGLRSASKRIDLAVGAGEFVSLLGQAAAARPPPCA